MRYPILLTNRLCAAVLLASMVVASATASCFADEPAAKVEAPSGYEDAPEANEVPPAPVRDLSNLDEFGKATAILDGKVDANVVNLEKAYLPFFQRLVRVERSFLLRACKLDKEQQSRISEVSDRCAKVAARQYAMAHSGGMRARGKAWGGFAPMNVNGPIMHAGGRGNPNAAMLSNPRGAVGRLLLLAVDGLLSAEQKERYAEEDRRRKDYLKQTTILNMVVLIDKRLVLTVQQREQLIESLTKNWDPSWSGALQHLISSNNDYLPRIQDKHVVKFLGDKQKVLWQGIQKVGFGISGNFGIGQTPTLIEDKFAGQKASDVDAAVPLGRPLPVRGGGMF